MQPLSTILFPSLSCVLMYYITLFHTNQCYLLHFFIRIHITLYLKQYGFISYPNCSTNTKRSRAGTLDLLGLFRIYTIAFLISVFASAADYYISCLYKLQQILPKLCSILGRKISRCNIKYRLTSGLSFLL